MWSADDFRRWAERRGLDSRGAAAALGIGQSTAYAMLTGRCAVSARVEHAARRLDGDVTVPTPNDARKELRALVGENPLVIEGRLKEIKARTGMPIGRLRKMLRDLQPIRPKRRRKPLALAHLYDKKWDREDFCAWMQRCGLTKLRAAAALRVSAPLILMMRAGVRPVSARTQLNAIAWERDHGNDDGLAHLVPGCAAAVIETEIAKVAYETTNDLIHDNLIRSIKARTGMPLEILRRELDRAKRKAKYRRRREVWDAAAKRDREVKEKQGLDAWRELADGMPAPPKISRRFVHHRGNLDVVQERLKERRALYGSDIMRTLQDDAGLDDIEMAARLKIRTKTWLRLKHGEFATSGLVPPHALQNRIEAVRDEDRRLVTKGLDTREWWIGAAPKEITSALRTEDGAVRKLQAAMLWSNGEVLAALELSGAKWRRIKDGRDPVSRKIAGQLARFVRDGIPKLRPVVQLSPQQVTRLETAAARLHRDSTRAEIEAILRQMIGVEGPDARDVLRAIRRATDMDGLTLWQWRKAMERAECRAERPPAPPKRHYVRHGKDEKVPWRRVPGDYHAVRGWLTTCRRDDRARTETMRLYEAWSGWARERDLRPGSVRGFVSQLLVRGLRRERDRRTNKSIIVGLAP